MIYSASVFLPSGDDTAHLGARIAPMLRPGDTLLLEGSIGAGKTSLARAIIQARLEAVGLAEDVPSPTYTLVQTYTDTAMEIWHADLYRLTGTSDILELGLEEAFRVAVVLVEWPDRLGSLSPPDALHISLTAENEGRRADFTSPSLRWREIDEVLADA